MIKNFLNSKNLKFTKNPLNSFLRQKKFEFSINSYTSKKRLILSSNTNHLKYLFLISKKSFAKFVDNENSKEIENNDNNEEKNNLLNNLDIEFEKLLEKSNNTELEKRVKILSIKLLQANHSREIMNLYEEKYLKNFIEISAEEIILILYFYTCLLDRESTHNVSNNPLKSNL